MQIIRLTKGADIARVQRELVRRGLWLKKLEGGAGVSFWVEANSALVSSKELLEIEGVEDVAVSASAHPLLDAQERELSWLGAPAGGLLMAGPCAVESEEQIHHLAGRVQSAGAQWLRGGAFKPRTSPYSFQGHGAQAVQWLSRAAKAHGLKCVTEVMSLDQAELIAEQVDLLQIGSRNMQNFSLLAGVARQGKPVLLKRGMSATIEEWLLAAEYCLLHGASSVVFCERGIRSFDDRTRNLLDLGAVALLSQVYGLPVLVDPSHASGRRDIIPALSRAAMACGATGLVIEVHDAPGEALSDGPQALSSAQLLALAAELGFSASAAHGEPGQDLRQALAEPVGARLQGAPADSAL